MSESAHRPTSTRKRPNKPSPKSPKGADAAQAFAIEAARLIHDEKCTDVLLLDVRGLSQVTDYLVIGSGTSDRQMRSALQHLEELGQANGYGAFRTNADDRSTWVLADFVDVVVHMFEPNTRAHYDLEMLWGDAKRIDWERPGQTPRNRAGLRADDVVDHPGQ